MTRSARSFGVFADFRRLRALRWIFAAAFVAALAAPGAADARAARKVRMGGGYDGIWNVLIITQTGSCDPAYSYPFRISGSRISTAGAADVSGSVGRGGGVVVRISAGGSVANGSGRLGTSNRRGPLERKTFRRQLQRPLAGHAGLISPPKMKMARQIVWRAVLAKFTNAQNSQTRMADANQRGASTITT